jgi:hypothetical protein
MNSPEVLSVEEIEDFVLQLNDAVQNNGGAVPASMASKLHKYADQVRPMMQQLQEETQKAERPPSAPSSGTKKKRVSPSRPRMSTTQKTKSTEKLDLRKKLDAERLESDKSAAYKAQQNARAKMTRNETARERASERKQVLAYYCWILLLLYTFLSHAVG